MPLERVVVEIMSAAGWVIVSVSEAETLVEVESVTVADTVKVPALFVVPEMVALGVAEVKDNPVGRPVIVQV